MCLSGSTFKKLFFPAVVDYKNWFGGGDNSPQQVQPTQAPVATPEKRGTMLGRESNVQQKRKRTGTLLGFQQAEGSDNYLKLG